MEENIIRTMPSASILKMPVIVRNKKLPVNGDEAKSREICFLRSIFQR